MKALVAFLMIGNSALFLFGAMQHAGITLGRFHEPVIAPAAIVEAICGLSLLWGVAGLLRHSRTRWQAALIANFVRSN